jgi:hypothetical protein
MASDTHERGFVALISIIMLSVVLLASTLSLAQFGLVNRYFILDLENKSVSERLAEACVHVARIQIYNNPDYEPSTPITIAIGGSACTISMVDPGVDESTIEATATMGNSVTNYRVVVDTDDGEFLSWNEVSVF